MKIKLSKTEIEEILKNHIVELFLLNIYKGYEDIKSFCWIDFEPKGFEIELDGEEK